MIALIAGIAIGFVLARIYYRQHIAIAQDVISADLARMWVERNTADMRY